MRRNWFTSGDWNAICDVCGFKRKASQMALRWDGLMVCAPTVKQGCWEIRHPQDLIRPIPDQKGLPWTRPESNDVFLETNYNAGSFGCSPIAQLSQANYGQVNCMTIGNIDSGLIIE